MRGLFLKVVILSAFYLAGISSDPLHCFQCVSVECSEAEPDCDEDGLRSFIKSELGSLYYTDQMETCPSGEHGLQEWRIMQYSNPACPQSREREATCAAGRMQLRVQVKHPNGSDTELVHYATVLGCAKRQLVRNVNYAFGQRKCAMDIRNKTFSSGVNHLLKIEHCREIPTLCYHEDYCVHHNMSEVRIWATDVKEQQDSQSRLWWQIGACAVIVVTFIVCVTWAWIDGNTEKKTETPPGGTSNENELNKPDPIPTFQYSSEIEKNMTVQKSDNNEEIQGAAAAASSEETRESRQPCPLHPHPPGHNNAV